MRNVLVLSLSLVLAVLGCGSDDDGGGSSCAEPSGIWSITLSSTDPACPGQTITGQDFTTADDGCSIALESFDSEACVYMQQATCEGYTGTLVFRLNAASDSLTGTTTIESDDGTTCDYDATGARL